jgi:SsrA-binding protein
VSDIVTNPSARRDYHVVDTFEAGIVLRGTEVKSLRSGRGQIRDAFARVENGEVWLYNAHIEEYSHGTCNNHVPKAPRKLLLNRNEIRKLLAYSAVKGHALVPLRFYWKNQRVKVGLAEAEYDKREDVKRREAERELKRAVMHRMKRG